MAAVHSAPLTATGLVFLAAVLDALDGAAARREGGEGEFGTNLDSLADIVSFGVAPALSLLLVASGGPALAQVSVAVACALFVVCGAIRLARFPLVKSRDHFVGLPIPPAGVAVAVLAALAPPVIVSPMVLVLAGLMVGRFRMPSLSALARRSGERRLRRPVGETVPHVKAPLKPPRNG